MAQQAIMHCFRCPAFDGDQCNRECGINSALLTRGKAQGYNCKRQRWEHNRMISQMNAAVV